MSVLGAGGKLRRSFRRFGVWEETEEENPSQASCSERERHGEAGMEIMDQRDHGMDIMDEGQEVPAAADFLECTVSF